MQNLSSLTLMANIMLVRLPAYVITDGNGFDPSSVQIEWFQIDGGDFVRDNNGEPIVIANTPSY